jgi:hypothetical protein
MMFSIELETNNDVDRSWNRKIFIVERAAKLLTHLQSAESFIGESRFDEAIKQANAVWELITENGKEDETKLKCRNILAEAYQKTEMWEEASYFTAESLKCHPKDVKTLILALMEALHCRNWAWIRYHGGVAEDILINIIKRNEGNDLY